MCESEKYRGINIGVGKPGEVGEVSDSNILYLPNIILNINYFLYKKILFVFSRHSPELLSLPIAMVSSRLVDFPDDPEEEITGPFPDLMFAEGEEPVGVRVLTYQSSRALNTILEVLDEDEIQYLRKTPFGKLVDIAEKPAFSGRFARYLLSRQLKVEKKHEAWFRFASKPIRFSLREFAIVTGLPCGEIPKKSRPKKKKNIKEKPYWPELFGSVEEVTVARAVKMLQKKIVTDRDIRIKIACLAIVSSVLLSTNLRMKMLKEHAELLVDMDEFFAYPWGRLAFDLLMTSIKKKR